MPDREEELKEAVSNAYSNLEEALDGNPALVNSLWRKLINRRFELLEYQVEKLQRAEKVHFELLNSFGNRIEELEEK